MIPAAAVIIFYMNGSKLQDVFLLDKLTAILCSCAVGALKHFSSTYAFTFPLFVLLFVGISCCLQHQ
jgi:hypothetical protein